MSLKACVIITAVPQLEVFANQVFATTVLSCDSHFQPDPPGNHSKTVRKGCVKEELRNGNSRTDLVLTAAWDDL